jgi:hypothetical protein
MRLSSDFIRLRQRARVNDVAGTTEPIKPFVRKQQTFSFDYAFLDRLAVSSDSMVWRPHVDQRRKQETGGDDNGKASQAPRSLRRCEGALARRAKHCRCGDGGLTTEGLYGSV